MSTAANIIERAMRLIGQLPAGGTPTVNEYADGLVALNAMISSWNNDRIMCFATREESLTLSSGTASYTIGPSGTLNTTRPVAIEAAYVLSNGVSYDVDVITDAQYAGIANKTAQSNFPEVIYYQPSMSTGTLYVYPVPNASATLKLITRTPLAAFAATSDTVTLPPGWEEALTYNLAVRFAPEFDTEAQPSVVQIATTSKASIKRANTKPAIMDGQIADLASGGSFNIFTGR
jgi:hypothetical protein